MTNAHLTRFGGVFVVVFNALALVVICLIPSPRVALLFLILFTICYCAIEMRRVSVHALQSLRESPVGSSEHKSINKRLWLAAAAAVGLGLNFYFGVYMMVVIPIEAAAGEIPVYVVVEDYTSYPLYDFILAYAYGGNAFILAGVSIFAQSFRMTDDA